MDQCGRLCDMGRVAFVGLTQNLNFHHRRSGNVDWKQMGIADQMEKDNADAPLSEAEEL